jgi:hypothetical protein
MSLFKSKMLSWWQIGIVKFSVFCIGIAIGAYWSAVFLPYVTTLLIVGIAVGLYAVFFWIQK